jgi:hypothetical protein
MPRHGSGCQGRRIRPSSSPRHHSRTIQGSSRHRCRLFSAWQRAEFVADAFGLDRPLTQFDFIEVQREEQRTLQRNETPRMGEGKSSTAVANRLAARFVSPFSLSAASTAMRSECVRGLLPVIRRRGPKDGRGPFKKRPAQATDPINPETWCDRHVMNGVTAQTVKSTAQISSGRAFCAVNANDSLTAT